MALENGSLVTIPNVPIVSTGTYHLASGITTFTEEHLIAAIAAQDDPAVTVPRLKIGHESDFGDGEPAFGKILNMHLGDNNQTIYGDYVGVPRWLAELMPTAYPARSIEGAFDAVVTEGGRPHALLITAVSLLGVVAPGVSTLEDLPTLYGDEAPAGLEIIATTNLVAGNKIIAKSVGGDMPKLDIAAAVDVDQVRRTYYDSLQGPEMWWWICRIEIEPMQLIVDDEEGGLYRVPFDPSGDEVTFEEPVPVEIVYVDKGTLAAAAKAVGGSTGAQVLASFANRSESRPDTKEQEDGVDPKELRASLGLAEDASDEVVKAKISELKAAQDETEEQKKENEGDDPVTKEEPKKEGEVENEGDEPEVEAGTVTIDKATLAQLKANSALGVEARQQQLDKEREDELTAAVKAGKFPRARKEHWRKAWVKDPEGTKAAIADLEPGLIPVSAEAEANEGGEETLTASTYEQSWLSPGERARISAAREGQGPDRITQEVVQR